MPKCVSAQTPICGVGDSKEAVVTPLENPFGVTVIRQHYPGFLDLLPNSIYHVENTDMQGAVVFVGHKRPLIVIDFENELIERKLSDGGVFVDIREPISNISIDSMSANARGFEGCSGPAVAIELDPDGRVFCQDVYSTLHVMWEVSEWQSAQKMGQFAPLLNRFIATYNFLNNDPRIRMTGGLPEEANPTRIGYYVYSDAEKRLPFHERIRNAEPQNWQLHIAGLGRGARALQDHKGDDEVIKQRSELLGSYLFNSMVPSDNLIEISRLATLAFVDDRPKAAIIEAMSILELVIIDKRRTLIPKTHDKKPKDMTWQFMINAVLPTLLNLYDGDKDGTMKRANEALEIRNKVVHRGYSPSKEDANIVLSFARHVLCIFQLPDAAKGTWKRRGT